MFALDRKIAAYALVLSLGGAPGLCQAANMLKAPGGGQVRALLIGIDDYTGQDVPKLKGALADAKDLENSLRNAGVTDVIRIEEEAATRKNYALQMKKLIAKATAGDLAIVSFAGHGFQIDQPVKTKQSGKDEAFVLRKYDQNLREPTIGGSDLVPKAEYIRGPEMKSWLLELEAKGVDVVFIADSCHGGGMTRSIDSRDSGLTFRTIKSPANADAERFRNDMKVTPKAEMTDFEDYNRVTFLAAVDPSTKAPEVQIRGERTLRGALSYSLARSIDRVVAVATPQTITRRELFEKTKQEVSQYSETRQRIFTRPTAALDTTVLVAGTRDTPPPPPPPPPVSPVSLGAPLKIAVINGSRGALRSVGHLTTPFEAVDDEAGADMTWDVTARDVISRGDIIARDVSAQDIPGVVDRIAASRIIASMGSGRVQQFELLPDNGVHEEGQALKLSAANVSGKYLIVFSIAGDGEVQYHFPTKDDTVPQGARSYDLEFKAGRPFGSDLVIVISSDTRLTGLEASLADKDGKRVAGVVPELLSNALKSSPGAKIGTTVTVTGPRGAK